MRGKSRPKPLLGFLWEKQGRNSLGLASLNNPGDFGVSGLSLVSGI